MTEEDFARDLAKARSGNETAWKRLHDGFKDSLLGYARSKLAEERVGVKFSGSEVVQQMWLLTIQNLDQFRGQTEREFETWLFAILNHQLSNMSREFWGTEMRDLNREKSLDANPKLDLSNENGKDEPKSPSGVVVQEEDEQRLTKAISQLPQQYQEVIRLRTYQDLPWEEVGNQLGRSGEAARLLHARALLALEDQYGNLGGGDRGGR